MATNTNGRCVVNVKGVEYPLYFNLPACEEFTKRLDRSIVDNEFQTIADMIYSGLFGFAVSVDKPAPVWAEVYELVTELHDEEDFVAQVEHINEVFSNSKEGARVLGQVEEVKKKILTIMETAMV